MILAVRINSVKLFADKPTYFDTDDWELSVAKSGGNDCQPVKITVMQADRVVWQTEQTENLVAVVCNGLRLKSFNTYTVIVSDAENACSCEVRTAFLHPAEWRWIAAPACRGIAPVFRKKFCAAECEKAELLLCGLGLYHPLLNGQELDDTILNPYHTVYHKTLLYRVFDITGLIRHENCLDITLGNGFYGEGHPSDFFWHDAPWKGPLQLAAFIRLENKAGAVQWISTDDTWQVSLNGPTRENSIYQGECFDARRLQDQNAGFAAAAIVPSPQACMQLQMPPFIRRTKGPELTIEKKPYGWLITADHTTTGWLRLMMEIPRGERVQIRYAERCVDGQAVLDESYQAVAVSQSLQTDELIGNGETVTFEPRFSYKGFRYVSVFCTAGCSLCRAQAVDVRNDAQPIQAFRCAEKLFNHYHENTLRSMQCNLHGKPTDTPVYEKNGWLGDAGICLEGLLSNLDLAPLLEKWLQDIADGQDERGLVPLIAPVSPRCKMAYDCDTVWNAAYILTVSELYRYTGRRSILRKHYAAMCRLAQVYEERFRARGWTDGNEYLADWAAPSGIVNERCEIPPEGSALAGSVWAVRAFEALAKIAAELSRQEDRVHFLSLAGRVREQIGKTLYDADACEYRTHYEQSDMIKRRTSYRQTSQILPVWFGMPGEEEKPRILRRLCADIEQKMFADTGILGSKYILPLLTREGRGQLALSIARNTRYPSWGFWVAQGADTMWEAYETNARSRNHFFFGTVTEWLMEWVAGIRDMEEAWKHYTVAPAFVREIPSLEFYMDTVRGPASLTYEWEKGILRCRMQVPFGATARFICGPCKKMFLTGIHEFQVKWDEELNI